MRLFLLGDGDSFPVVLKSKPRFELTFSRKRLALSRSNHATTGPLKELISTMLFTRMYTPSGTRLTDPANKYTFQISM